MPKDFELEPMLEDQADNDGAVTLLSGYEVLGRILAQHGPVKYTKALLDSGDIPYGTVIESLTGPIEEAGEGMIAKVENTGTGEATVTVQVTSIGIPVGFACKGVVLYVEDPDTSEDVAYTYLDLHQHPAWIRAEGGATGSLTTFEIQSIISGATSVQAIINPNALARIEDLKNYAPLNHGHQIADIEGLRGELDDYQSNLDDFILKREKGAAEGVASLDSSGKVPASQLPEMNYIPSDEKGKENGVATLGADGKLSDGEVPAAVKMAYTNNEQQTVAGALDSLFQGLKDGTITAVIATATAQGWSEGVQTLTVQGMTADSLYWAGLSSAAGTAQRDAARKAVISPTAQGNNSLTLTADGAVPTVDLPILVYISGGVS